MSKTWSRHRKVWFFISWRKTGQEWESLGCDLAVLPRSPHSLADGECRGCPLTAPRMSRFSPSVQALLSREGGGEEVPSLPMRGVWGFGLRVPEMRPRAVVLQPCVLEGGAA